MAKITEDISWLKTGEPQDQEVLNRPLKQLHNDLKRYDIPLEISDSKGSNSEQVINQEQLTKMLSGWGSNELPEQPDGQDTMTNGVYKASGLDFGNDIDGKDGTLLVIGSETQDAGNKGEINQIVFGNGWMHTRYSDDQDQNGKPNWKEWHTVQTVEGIREQVKPMPVGQTYIQFPGMSAPATLFGGTWSAQFDNEGIFFRTPGSNASAFGGDIQGDAIRNITGNTFAHNTWSGLVRFTQSGAFARVNYNAGFNVRSGGSDPGAYLKFDASRVVPTAAENRPRNRTIRVWLKTAN